MVRGIKIFKQYFGQFPNNYLIIGGTACDIILGEAALTPRTTKDIDIILIVEALSKGFISQFWKFIADGNYEKNEKNTDERKYYRFTKPENTEFPYQIELFSRIPDLIETGRNSHLTPIPVDDDMSSLSAILLSTDYYNYMISHSTLADGVHIASTEALICLKAKAFLEISERIASGSKEPGKQLSKHKNDIFRLIVMLSENSRFELPEIIKSHMQAFAEIIKNELPDSVIYKEMGLKNINVEKIFTQFKINFQL
jgi:hypothetical protein